EGTIFNYGQYFLGLPKGNIFQVKIGNTTNAYNSGLGDIVEASPGSIASAVHDFLHPDVSAANVTGSAVLHAPMGAKPKAPRPSATTVSVMNASGIAGSAGLAVSGLDRIGYRILYPPNQVPADAPAGTCPYVHCFKTQVYWNPAKKRSKAAAGR